MKHLEKVGAAICLRRRVQQQNPSLSRVVDVLFSWQHQPFFVKVCFLWGWT